MTGKFSAFLAEGVETSSHPLGGTPSPSVTPSILLELAWESGILLEITLEVNHWRFNGFRAQIIDHRSRPFGKI